MIKFKKLIPMVCTVAAATCSSVQAESMEAVGTAKAYYQSHGAQIVRDFAELLSIPNSASDAANIRRNAEYIVDLFAGRGFNMELLEVNSAPPLVYGYLPSPGAKRTIAFYVHYDGQPVEANEWTNPPFQPTLYTRAITNGGEKIELPRDGEAINPEWRLYARSAADDKAPLISLVAAIDALQEKGIPFTSNVVLVFDGEEEAASDELDSYLSTFESKFSDVDLWLFCDGPVHQSGKAQLVFGVRGISSFDLTVYGPNKGLHSGHYGNWAPGPGWRLAQLLASMKNAEGNVQIDGFYESTVPLSIAEREAVAATPYIDEELRNALSLSVTEHDNAPLAERIMLPALNLKGLKSAGVGRNARNVIPPSATASIGIRLAKGNDPSAMLDLVEAHIQREGYQIVRETPNHQIRMEFPLVAKIIRREGYPAVRSDMNDPEIAPLVDALRVVAKDLILFPTLGGSLPLYLFEKTVPAPIVILPIANHDSNQHAADENIRLGSLFYGVEAFAATLTMK